MTWKKVRLSEVCNLQNGFAFKSKLFKEKGKPILRISNIQNQKIDINKIVYFNPNDYNLSMSRYEVKPNDLLIAMSGATTGKIGFNNTDSIFYLNQRVGNLKPKSSINKYFLYYLLSTKVEQNLKISKGAAQPNLSSEQIKNITFSLPPLEEQQRIVAKLDNTFAEIDKIVEYSSFEISNINNLEQRILNGWIEKNANSEDYYTVQDCINNEWIKPPFDGNHGEIHPQASDYTVTGVPFVMARDFLNGHVDLKNCKFISPKQASSLRVGFAKNDDVLFTHKGTIGEVALLKCKEKFVMLTPQVTAYRVIDEARVNRMYLYYLFKSSLFQNQIQKIAGIGTTRAYIGITRQKQLKLCLPPMHLQNEAVEILKGSEPHFSKINILKKHKFEKLTKLKSAILRQELQIEAA